MEGSFQQEHDVQPDLLPLTKLVHNLGRRSNWRTAAGTADAMWASAGRWHRAAGAVVIIEGEVKRWCNMRVGPANHGLLNLPQQRQCNCCATHACR